jgi:DNA-directed RNA polymerase beta' subunit
MSSIRDSLPSVIAKLKAQTPPPAGFSTGSGEANDDREMSVGGAVTRIAGQRQRLADDAANQCHDTFDALLPDEDSLALRRSVDGPKQSPQEGGKENDSQGGKGDPTSGVVHHSTGETNYDRINEYGAVRISLASPHDIRSWSFGEVKKPETINYRTYRPEKEGMFCERIFGPEKDWECACGKYRGMKYKGMICDRCGVKLTHSRVRRKRMGHIELAAPVVHIWFLKAKPCRLGTLLDMKRSSLRKIVYFQDYIITEPDENEEIQAIDAKKQTITEDQYRTLREKYGEGFKAEMGAEAIKKLLEKLDLVTLSAELRERLNEELRKEPEGGKKPSKQKLKGLVKRLKVVEALRDSGRGGPQNKPEWMVLECIPVIPADLRPLVLLDSGNFATSDLNDLYRRIINRNNRLKKLVDLNAFEVIIRNEKRMLQQTVDALFDNKRCKRPVLGSANRPLVSLTDMIEGKQGRFRENLLGKRVDYSARSVIAVDPELKLHQCGLPKKIALELFQPFLIRRLKELGHANTIKSAKKMLERKGDQVWDTLEEVIKNHPVLLNRARTLDRMHIVAFEPTLIEGNAIRIHPLVCTGFHADFDGDQMAVHLPLSTEAQVEATVLMMSTNNIFSPANGQPIIAPTQDIVLGCYYITVHRGEPDEAIEPGDGMTFANPDEVILAHDLGRLGVHARIRVRLLLDRRVITEIGLEDGQSKVLEPPRLLNGRVRTTVGRVLFNDLLPSGVNSTGERIPFYDMAMSEAQLKHVIADCYGLLGRKETIELLDRMKEFGFRQMTRSGLSISMEELQTRCQRKEQKCATMTETQSSIVTGLTQALAELPILVEKENRLQAWEASLNEQQQFAQRVANEAERMESEAKRGMADLEEREQSFQDRENAVREQQANFSRQETALLEREKTLGSKETKIREWLRDGDRRESALLARERELQTMQQVLNERQRALAAETESWERRRQESDRIQQESFQQQRIAQETETRRLLAQNKILEQREAQLQKMKAAMKMKKERLQRQEAALHAWQLRLKTNDRGANAIAAGPQKSVSGTSRKLVTIPGEWYSRVPGTPNAPWHHETSTPASVVLNEGQVFCLSVRKDASDADMAGLVDLADIAQLQVLLMQGNEQTTDATLLLVSRMRHIQSLDLQGCIHVTDTGMAYLSGMIQLRVLSLNGCSHVTDAGVLHLFKLVNLQKFEVRRTTRVGMLGGLMGRGGISASRLAAFKATVPNCVVIES